MQSWELRVSLFFQRRRINEREIHKIIRNFLSAAMEISASILHEFLNQTMENTASSI